MASNNSKINVLYLSPLPPPAGGIATWTSRICAHGLGERYVPRVINTRLRGARRNHERMRLTAMELFRTARIFSDYLWGLLVTRPKIVHINCSLSPYGVARDLLCARIAKRVGRRLVVHYRGNVPDFRSHAAGGRARRWFNRLASLADVNLVLNRPSLQALKSLLGRERGIRILPNFIDVTTPEPSLANGVTSFPYRLIYVGGMTSFKGGEEVLEVARRLPDAEMVIVGDVMQDMRGGIAGWPRNVLHVGHVEHGEVLRQLSRAHALLFPSHSEGFPNAVLEAMLAGLPVIATKVGAIPEMIDDHLGGFLVERGDVEGMVQAAEHLRREPSLGERMGRRNRERCLREYAYEPVVERLTAIYDRLLEGERQ